MERSRRQQAAPTGGSFHHGHEPAVVALEDGLALHGRSVGAPGTSLGEMVFTTAMSGYQETTTDPSYIGQILCFAAPIIGNRSPHPTPIALQDTLVGGHLTPRGHSTSS